MYGKKSLDGFYYRAKGFYLFCIPVSVPYKYIYAMAEEAGFKKKEAFGPILEKNKMFGFGWIGIEVEKPAAEHSDVVQVSGHFDMYEHQGPYTSIGQAYKKIMKEKSGAQEYLNLYLDDPQKVAPEKCRTQILFR